MYILKKINNLILHFQFQNLSLLRFHLLQSFNLILIALLYFLNFLLINLLLLLIILFVLIHLNHIYLLN